MAKKPVKSKRKPKSANRVRLTLKPGDTIENSGIYRSDISKTRATLVKGDFAPAAPLKSERWLQVAPAPVDQT